MGLLRGRERLHLLNEFHYIILVVLKVIGKQELKIDLFFDLIVNLVDGLSKSIILRPQTFFKDCFDKDISILPLAIENQISQEMDFFAVLVK